MRTVLSWIPNSDFDRVEVKQDGPTLEFHRYHFRYDRHILLSSGSDEDSDPKSLYLKQALSSGFPGHHVEVCYMNIANDDLIFPDKILPKVETLLSGLLHDELDLFISPGTPAMQIAWYMAVSALKLDQVRLVQTIPPKFRKEKNELLESHFRIDGVAGAAILPKVVHTADYLISPAIKPVYELAKSVASTDKTFCLISGATGTGKEHLAHYIHQQSARCDKPFLTLNCSAFSDQLLESRLFGYRKGAFTDAKDDTSGFFEKANGGTLLLDEIGDITPFMQQSLLRVLQTGDLTRIGDTKVIHVDVRVVAATHRNLPTLCEAGTFRWDLYYRLAVVELELPSLQERGLAEKQQLIDHLIRVTRNRLKRTKLLAFDKEARSVLEGYSFPGNIRQLENLIESLYVTTQEGRPVQVGQLPRWLKQPTTHPDSFDWKTQDAALIRRALSYFGHNLTHTCNAIGYSLNTLKSRMKEYGIRADTTSNLLTK